jgi:hypothetical protein
VYPLRDYGEQVVEKNEQKSVLVTVMLCQNTVSHIKYLCSFRFGGDNDYVLRYDKFNVAMYHQRVCIAVQND